MWRIKPKYSSSNSYPVAKKSGKEWHDCQDFLGRRPRTNTQPTELSTISTRDSIFLWLSWKRRAVQQANPLKHFHQLNARHPLGWCEQHMTYLIGSTQQSWNNNIRKQVASGYGCVYLTMIKSHYCGYCSGLKQQLFVMLTVSGNWEYRRYNVWGLRQPH